MDTAQHPARDLRPIVEVGADLGFGADDLILYGRHMAKLGRSALKRLEARGPTGRIVLVSAINPTAHGEGKTTVSIGLAQGLRRRGHRVALALREPSLGPIFGAKGGGTGGGRSSVVPSAQINLHFTGDLHAITSAHNLLAALVDNAVYFRNPLDIDHRQVLWRRVLDMNDRFLRHAVIGLGGKAHGYPREDGFDITAASEVMAVLCLCRNVTDLKARLGRIVVGFDSKGGAITAAQLEATGAMSALLADALLPNLVQTTEGCPAFVHGGPFGNIAHGCNSVIATRSAASAADFVVTEAGFGFDLGAEKFFDIHCRAADIWPRAVVIVVTARALRAHGGERPDLPMPGSLGRGLANLEQHLGSARVYGFDPVVAINCFKDDTEADLSTIESWCRERTIAAARFKGFTEGGAGAEALADVVASAANKPPQPPRFLYSLDETPEKKIETVAKTIYGAAEVTFTRDARRGLDRIHALGYAGLPICMAKTHLSLSDDPSAVGRPQGFELTVREMRLSAGAGYLLAITGDIVTMPGLPRVPAANRIDLTEDGEIIGVS
jgi:formate--tetrahydrofolate ligase